MELQQHLLAISCMFVLDFHEAFIMSTASQTSFKLPYNHHYHTYIPI
ncbi:hypothetical protein ANO14919_048230 [Xylariales sp. No.14919]|nr:hypothetical protein ANO14919_048230 [Xylariales sp. No.14919]